MAAAPGQLPLHTEAELTAYFRNAGTKDSIVKPASGLLKHPFLVPSGPYDQLFDWDSYFMGIALGYDGKGEPLADSVQDFLEFDGANFGDTGYIPREIATDGLWALPEMCKPFLAQAAVRASKTIGSYQWLKQQWFDRLSDTLAYWETARRAKDGFFIWYNGVESGTDNSPAVSSSPALTTEGVDLQVYIYREYLALAVIAHELGKDDATYVKKAEELKKRINEKMWSAEDGIYYGIDSRTGEPVRIKEWTSFTPLWANIPSPAQAKRMIESHVLNETEFWAPNGLRSLARTDPHYNPAKGYWRGPVWIVSDYLVMHGLMNYGYYAQAEELAQKTLDLLVEDFAHSGGMNECYDPETGAPAANGDFVSWDLLGEHILDEAQSRKDPTDLN